ncbi:DUF4038 domain-containing protein [Cohnella sp. GbtcB17]|uniref:apiosidase-like domain-containing protein n=1 Tax=Cohnella sp. GbtcB17 TaxID=2824762 RepID=UPI001C3105E6
MNNRIQISKDRSYLERAGKPFFYIADTVWSVFSNATLEEWAQYLDYRRSQGFNAVQISILPIIHDASESVLGIEPFHAREGGGWDYAHPNDAFFERAGTMARMASERGILPCLVVLWGNYAPGNWMSRQSEGSHVMPIETVRPYAELVARTFLPYSPMYFISGDTNFESEEAAAGHYLEALRGIKAVDPDAIASLHMNGGAYEIPADLERELDFYVYQSSHDPASQNGAYLLPEKFMAKSVRRPVLNAEPCYEGIGHFGKYGRFQAFDVRKAFWWSVLSGASAGFAYGAHGLWSWHRKETAFNSEDFYLTPFVWSEALRLAGAADVSLGGWLVEKYGLCGIPAAQDKLAFECPEIRVAAWPDDSAIFAYVPYSRKLALRVDPERYRFEAFDLDRRLPIVLDVRVCPEGALVELPETNADLLIAAIRI